MTGAEAGPTPHRKEVALHALVLTAVLVTLLVFYDDLLTLSFDELCNLGSCIAVACIASSVRVAPRGHLSASSVYVIVFCLFHFGLTMPLGLGIEPSEQIAGFTRSWIHRPETLEAILLASLAVLCCTIASSLVLLLRQRTPAHRAPSPPHPNLAPLGALLLTFWVVVWFALVVQVGGWRALFGSYNELLDLTADTPLHWPFLGIGLALTWVTAGANGPAKWLGFFVFGLYAVIAFPLGLRSTVLFPLSAALVVAARRGIRISGPLSLTLIAVVLALSTAAKDVRQRGLQRLDDPTFNVNPFDGLMELGSSLRPVVEVLTWEHAGDRRLEGSSYWAPIERAFERILPHAVRRDARKDERLMNVLVLERVGAIGFSPVAEAHYNFGPWGVLCVLFLIGIVLGILDAWPATPIHLCLTGAILLPLLINVRNSFTPIPAHLFVGTLSTALVFFVIGPHHNRKRSSRTTPLVSSLSPSAPQPKPEPSPRASR